MIHILACSWSLDHHRALFPSIREADDNPPQWRKLDTATGYPTPIYYFGLLLPYARSCEILQVFSTEAMQIKWQRSGVPELQYACMAPIYKQDAELCFLDLFRLLQPLDGPTHLEAIQCLGNPFSSFLLIMADRNMLGSWSIKRSLLTLLWSCLLMVPKSPGRNYEKSWSGTGQSRCPYATDGLSLVVNSFIVSNLLCLRLSLLIFIAYVIPVTLCAPRTKLILLLALFLIHTIQRLLKKASKIASCPMEFFGPKLSNPWELKILLISIYRLWER